MEGGNRGRWGGGRKGEEKKGEGRKKKGMGKEKDLEIRNRMGIVILLWLRRWR